ncbi:glycosyltransferase involved in cell wall biosynthesis [Acinetobacter baylyi]|uniref:Glycosyltransferase involved in cell wall biosynthesis n=1 Tax=Acinetobacter baylyi TaxID=202950 RepID=A0ABU0UXJ2_ACIBI|nr:glycosyltransferase [Acinetobacter baylyi]MDQ1209280.1 glycosyltransferase involved in cell wall biosynthesis [Acinetobacter baylyi]MDR6107128.1 glycosyltransferase involved in cell wall biosynthesis [Acinetobacter baylyi]MDR6186151.1 glycosyltransferase involved in cell wall biosynthesis [Acinetobacter baylyi]
MKKVALVIPTLGGGGAERTAVLLANGFAAAGVHTSVIVVNVQGEKGKLQAELAPQVELVDLNCKQVKYMTRPFAAWLKQVQPDAIISTMTHTNIMVYWAKLRAGVSSKLICRETSTASINLKHRTGLKKFLLQTAMRWVYQRCDVLVPVSKGVAQDMQQYLGVSLPKTHVIYDPVITPELFDLAQRTVDDAWFTSTHDIPVIVAAGRLTEAKNYSLLLRAFAELIQFTPARLLILGEGEQRASLQQLVESLGVAASVSMPGFRANPFAYMAKADVYVMSSQWEGLPGALIQALALQCNIVSTDCPSGPREILEDGRYGVLVPNHDQQALTQALRDVLTGQVKTEKSQQAEQIYGLDAITQAYLALI